MSCAIDREAVKINGLSGAKIRHGWKLLFVILIITSLFSGMQTGLTSEVARTLPTWLTITSTLIGVVTSLALLFAVYICAYRRNGTKVATVYQLLSYLSLVIGLVAGTWDVFVGPSGAGWMPFPYPLGSAVPYLFFLVYNRRLILLNRKLRRCNTIIPTAETSAS